MELRKQDDDDDPSIPDGYVSLAQLRQQWLQQQDNNKKQQQQQLRKTSKQEDGQQDSVPADYVSLAQLQEKWLQKKLKSKPEEDRGKPTRSLNQENRLLGFENDGDVEMGCGFRRNGGGKGVGGVVVEEEEEDKGRRKGFGVVGFENGDENNQKKVVGGYRNDKMGVIEEDKGKGKEIGVVGFENQRQKKKKMAGGYRRERLQGRKEGSGAGKEEMGCVIEEDKGKGKEVGVVGFENGDENQKKGYWGKGKSAGVGEKGNGVEGVNPSGEIKEFDEAKMGVLSGESGNDGGIGETESVCMVEDLDVKTMGLKGGLRHKSKKEYVGRYNRLKWTEEKPDLEKKMEDGNRHVNDGGSEAKVGVLSGNDGICDAIGKIESVCMVEVLDAKTVKSKGGSRYKSKKEYGGRYNRLKWTEEKSDLVRKMEDGNGHVKREMRNKDKYDKSKESRRDHVLNGKNVEMGSKKKDEDEILEVCSEIGKKENRVEGNGLNDNRVIVVKKVDDDEGSVVEGVKNGEKGEIGDGYRRSDGNICRKFDGLTLNERRAGGNMRSRAERGFRDNRRRSRSYARLGRFKQIESGMMWVKKDKSGTDGS